MRQSHPLPVMFAWSEWLSQRLFASAAELRIVQSDFLANCHQRDLHGGKRTERVDRNWPVLDTVRRQALDFLDFVISSAASRPWIGLCWAFCMVIALGPHTPPTVRGGAFLM